MRTVALCALCAALSSHACDGDKGTCSTVPQRGPDPRDPQPRWPEFMPPFLHHTLRFAPDGMLWVRRTVPAYSAPSHDVIDGSGKLVRKVERAKRTRIIGFGANGANYISRRDENDLEFLQRYRLK